MERCLYVPRLTEMSVVPCRLLTSHGPVTEAVVVVALDMVEFLGVHDGRLQYIDPTTIQTLELLHCGKYCSETIEHLNLRKCTNLQELDVSGCSRLVSLDCKGCPALRQINADGCRRLYQVNGKYCCRLQEVDFSGCIELRYLNLSGCRHLRSVNLDDCYSLEMLVLTGTMVSGLDLSNRPRLRHVDCRNNARLRCINLTGSRPRTIRYDSLTVVYV